MGRTPRPPDSKVFQYSLSLENDAHIRSLVSSLGKSTTEVLHRELEFLRTWGLSAFRLPRLLHAAEAEFATPLQYVTALLGKSATQFPAVAPPAEESVVPGRKPGNVFFSAGAQEFVHRHAAERRQSFPRALDELITYARTYSLTRGQLATLRGAAMVRGGGLRDLVLDLISDHARHLPDAPVPRRAQAVRHEECSVATM